MIPTWLALSLGALLIWGFWGLFANLAARHLGGFSALIWEVTGAMMVGALVFGYLLYHRGLETPVRGVSFGIATGVTYTVGLAFLFLALNQAASQAGSNASNGNVHTIIILTALYPLVAVILNYLALGEPLAMRQIVGMLVGLAGIAILLSR